MKLKEILNEVLYGICTTLALVILFVLVLHIRAYAGPAEIDEHVPSGEHTWVEIQPCTVTAYCHCKKCCGKSNGITASGAKAMRYVTCAMKGVPFGTVIYIEGVGYRCVQDRGVGKNWVDIYTDDHQRALQFGLKKNRRVWIVEGATANEFFY